jgi:CTP-dependent riboflavin kinase
VILEFAERLDKADLQILNTAGELVKKVDVSNLSTYQLDISDLKSTNYIYRIITSKGQQTGSIVKQ